MEYIKIKNAEKIINESSYLVKTPEKYKNKWNDFFGNRNPIKLELGMGRGDFLINMAKKFPNINFVGIELSDSQLVAAVESLKTLKLSNIKLINADAKDIDKLFDKKIDTIYLTFSEP